MHHLLHFMQNGLPFCSIELDGLKGKQIVDIGVVAVGEGPALHHQALQPCGRVAECARAVLNQVFIFFVGRALDERRPLDRAQFGTDANLPEVINDRFRDIGIGRIAEIQSRIETVRISGVGKQLLRLCRIVHRRRRLPVVFEHVGKDGRPCNVGKPHGQRFVDGLAVDREAGGEAHLWVVPWRFRVPLIREINAEGALHSHRFDTETGGAAQFVGQLAPDRIGDVDFAPFQCRQPCCLVRDHFQNQPFHARCVAPVRLERFEHQLHARRK